MWKSSSPNLGESEVESLLRNRAQELQFFYTPISQVIVHHTLQELGYLQALYGLIEMLFQHGLLFIGLGNPQGFLNYKLQELFLQTD